MRHKKQEEASRENGSDAKSKTMEEGMEEDHDSEMKKWEELSERKI